MTAARERSPAITRLRSRLLPAGRRPALRPAAGDDDAGPRRSRPAGIRIGALTAAVVLAPAVAAGPAHADPAGRVCMFLAPENVFGLGHVGWAYRHGDGILWDYGATSFQDQPWRATGSLDRMLADFRTRERPPDAYLYFRCRGTAADDEAAAKTAADASDARPYNLITSNCLTRSLKVFHAYDGTADLASLGDGLLTAPRWYFDHDLDGFEPRARL